MGPLREVLRVIYGTDGRQFLSIYVKIYIHKKFPPCPPVDAHVIYMCFNIDVSLLCLIQACRYLLMGRIGSTRHSVNTW